MSSKIFSHIKKIIIVLSIIVMCTSHGVYAFSYKDNSNGETSLIQNLVNRLFNIEQKEEVELIEEENESDNSATGFMQGLLNKLFNLKPEQESQGNQRAGFMSGLKNKLLNIGKNKETTTTTTKEETTEKQETVVETAKRGTKTLKSSNKKITSINLVGNDRYKTTVLVANEAYPNGAENIILANGTSTTDGFLAEILANKLSAPILLTKKDTLNKDIKAEIKRLSPKKVYLIGGTSVISNSVENEVKNMKISTERIYGSTRYTTATAIAEKVSSFDKVILCNSKDSGKNVAAIAAIAAEKGMPILYNDSKSSINTNTFNFIKKYAGNIKTIYMIGNGASKSQKNTLSECGINIVEISGSNQYEINVKMIKNFSANYNSVVLVNNAIDAISISYLAAKNKSLFLYTNTNLTTEQKNIVKNNEISTIYYSGGGKIKETVNDVINTLDTKAVGITTSNGSDGYRAGTRLISNGIYTFPEFQQGKNVGSNYTVYQNVPYAGTGTLTGSGCNMFASACVISGLLGDPSIDPISHLKNVEAANVWYANTDNAFANDILEKYYGLHSKLCTTESEMLAFFESRNGDCAAIGYEPGHYFAMVPIMNDPEGYKFYVIDSYFGYTGKYKSSRHFIDTARANGFSNVEIDGGFGVRAVIYK